MSLRLLTRGIYCIAFTYELLALLYLMLPDIIRLTTRKISWEKFQEEPHKVSFTLSIAIFCLWIISVVITAILCREVHKRKRDWLKVLGTLQFLTFVGQEVLNGFKVELDGLSPIFVDVIHHLYLWVIEFYFLGVVKLGHDLEQLEPHFQHAFVSSRFCGVPVKRLLQAQFIFSWFAFFYMIYGVWIHWNLPNLRDRLYQTDAVIVIVLLLFTSAFIGPNAIILYKAVKNESLSLTIRFFWQKACLWFIVSAFYYAFARIRSDATNTGFPAVTHINELLVSIFNTLEHFELLYFIAYLQQKKKLKTMREAEDVFEIEMGNKRFSFDVKELDQDTQKFLASVRIDKTSISIGENKLLGEGNFGKVWLGKMNSLFSERRIVAVKVLESYGDPQFVPTLISELKTLSLVKDFRFLVKFYGAFWTDNDFGNVVGIVLEYCGLGNLEKHLRERKGLPEERKIVEKFPQWSYQIASAMVYLGHLKIIHGDLATRNVLLDAEEKVKVTDFGMSLRLYEYRIYATSKQSCLPWRSMPPEALEYNRFSSKSDVYSFGMTLWEMWSFGEVPWKDFSWSSDFTQLLKLGLKLNKPPLTPEPLFQGLIVKCWEIEESKRPTFTEILKTLSKSNVYS